MRRSTALAKLYLFKRKPVYGEHHQTFAASESKHLDLSQLSAGAVGRTFRLVERLCDF